MLNKIQRLEEKAQSEACVVKSSAGRVMNIALIRYS